MIRHGRIKKYKSIYENLKNENRVNYWIDYMSNAPESVIQDTATYYKNIKAMWNNGDIRLKRKEIDDLVSFQKAIDKLGLSRELGFTDR